MKTFMGFFLSAAFLFGACTCQNNRSFCKPSEILSPSQAREFKHHSSDLRIQASELQTWDENIQKWMAQTPNKKGDPYRLYTYLYYAQKLFADNSFALTNVYSGTLDAMSYRVVRLFYPEYENEDVKKDPFSEELADKLMLGIKKRYQEEERQIHSLTLKEKEGYWKGENPVGIYYPTMKPWALKRADEFKSAAPPSPNDPVWKSQLGKTQEKSQMATDEQRKKSFFWQKKIDPEAADWRYIAVNYMNEASIPLEMQLEVRSKMMMALFDALIAVFNDKYAYQVRRPFMLDPKLKPLFKTPNHPSYPAAHGTLSGAAEIILGYYFPENQKEWKRQAYEARESRLWGGIHFPMDLEAGKVQGREVGKAVLFR